MRKSKRFRKREKLDERELLTAALDGARAMEPPMSESDPWLTTCEKTGASVLQIQGMDSCQLE